MIRVLWSEGIVLENKNVKLNVIYCKWNRAFIRVIGSKGAAQYDAVNRGYFSPCVITRHADNISCNTKG